MGPELCGGQGWQQICRRLPRHSGGQRHPSVNEQASGEPSLLPQAPSAGTQPPAPVQSRMPLGTLTVCCSWHGWQVYLKLANWQYLAGPQSSSMMHSWGAVHSFVSERQVSSPQCPQGQSPVLPLPLPHRLGQSGSPHSPPAPAPAPALQHPRCHRAGLPGLLPSRMPHPSTQSGLCCPPPHTPGQGADSRAFFNSSRWI